MKLYFENTYGEARQIAECKDDREVRLAIQNFINECNKHKPKDNQFKSYYTRTWEEDGKTWFDVGSHTEFFYTIK